MVAFPKKAPEWYPEWEGQTVVIVASGPSAIEVPLDTAIGKAKFVAINRSLKLCPWADAWYCCDVQWWLAYFGGDLNLRREMGEFSGLKICIDYRIREHPDWDVRFLQVDKATDYLILDKPGVVAWGGNSGLNGLNWVAQLKPAKILLVGYDMTKRNGTHWHAGHGKGLSNPNAANVDRWRRAVDMAADPLKRAGIVTINCSHLSALRRYPKMTFEEALESDGVPGWKLPTRPPPMICTTAEAKEIYDLALDKVRAHLARGGKVPNEETVRLIANKLGQAEIERLAQP